MKMSREQSEVESHFTSIVTATNSSYNPHMPLHCTQVGIPVPGTVVHVAEGSIRILYTRTATCAPDLWLNLDRD